MKIRCIRWGIALALFVAAVFNYIDRNIFGLLTDTIQKELHIFNQEYASIINYFLVAYTAANAMLVAHAATSWLIDHHS